MWHNKIRSISNWIDLNLETIVWKKHFQYKLLLYNDLLKDRTLNRLRWIRVIHDGDWENHIEGTRQINLVTSG